MTHNKEYCWRTIGRARNISRVSVSYPQMGGGTHRPTVAPNPSPMRTGTHRPNREPDDEERRDQDVCYFACAHGSERVDDDAMTTRLAQRCVSSYVLPGAWVVLKENQQGNANGASCTEPVQGMRSISPVDRPCSFFARILLRSPFPRGFGRNRPPLAAQREPRDSAFRLTSGVKECLFGYR